MPAIPPFVLTKLYVKGSLQADESGFSLSLSNVIAPGTIHGIVGLTLDGQEVALDQVTVVPPSGESRPAGGVSVETPIEFPLGCRVRLMVGGEPLTPGQHRLAIRVIVKDVGPLEIPVSDTSA